MTLYRKQKESIEKFEQRIADQEQSSKAYRLSLEMRSLARILLYKAEQLEREIDHGQRI